MTPEINEVKVDETTLQQNIEQNLTQNSEPENEKDINWRKFKEARQKDREHAQEMAKKAAEKEAEAAALKAALEAIVNKQTPQNNQYYDLEETEDQRIERKVQEQLLKAEQRRQQEYEKKEKETLPQKLKEVHRDFDQVCSTENLDYLEFHYPEIAKAYRYMPDNVEKWDAVYKAVKRFVPNTSPNSDRIKAEKNLAKPQSISGANITQGQTPIPPIRLTEQRRKENWERMQRTLKGLS